MFDVRLRFTNCVPSTGPPGDSGRKLPSRTVGNKLLPVHRFPLLLSLLLVFERSLQRIACVGPLRRGTTPHYEDSSSLIILHAFSNTRDFRHHAVLRIDLHSLFTYSLPLFNVYLHNIPLLSHGSLSSPSINRLRLGLPHFYKFTTHFCAIFTSTSVQSRASTSQRWSATSIKSMRNLMTRPLTILAILLPLTNAVTLSEIQQINGFSPACENAYNTPLSGCTATDFSNGVCSASCIAFLNALTQIINAECTGTSAEPDTLMGSFFQHQGTGALCPNALGGSNQGQSSGGSYSLTTTVATSTSSIAETTVTSATSTAMTSTFTPSSMVQVTSILSASGAATTTSDVIQLTTVTPNAPSSASTAKTSHVKQFSTSTASASTSTSSSSDNGAGAKGGGTILDVGSNSSRRNAKIEDWVLLLLAGSAGLALLL